MGKKRHVITYTSRELRVGRFLFSQSKGSKNAHINLVTEEDPLMVMTLGAHFDPNNPEEGIWGYPPLSKGLSTAEWSELCQEAKQALEAMGGWKHFSEQPFETRRREVDA